MSLALPSIASLLHGPLSPSPTPALSPETPTSLLPSIPFPLLSIETSNMLSRPPIRCIPPHVSENRGLPTPSSNMRAPPQMLQLLPPMLQLHKSVSGCSRCGITHSLAWTRGIYDELVCDRCGAHAERRDRGPVSHVPIASSPPVPGPSNQHSDHHLRGRNHNQGHPYQRPAQLLIMKTSPQVRVRAPSEPHSVKETMICANCATTTT
ncbi:hypothetical protein BC830DRAFT_274646 [Chytriomyces sp. MP71]|nr:hypothetical protein BC830DRAFT_274646 [Chytriomyces sp. MP71]